MALVTGADCSAGLGDAIVVTYATRDPAGKTGSGASFFRGKAAALANLEKGTVYVAASAAPYAPELASLLGGDDV